MEGWTRVADQIRRARSDRKLTQAQLATEAGVSEPTIRVLETARRDSYNPATLRSVATALGWTPGSIDRILAGDEPELAQPANNGDRSLEEMFAALDRRLTAVEKIIQDAALTPDEKRRVVEGVAEGQRILDERKRRFNNPD